jgi:hypothetical protein
VEHVLAKHGLAANERELYLNGKAIKSIFSATVLPEASDAALSLLADAFEQPYTNSTVTGLKAVPG